MDSVRSQIMNDVQVPICRRIVCRVRGTKYSEYRVLEDRGSLSNALVVLHSQHRECYNGSHECANLAPLSSGHF